MNKYILDFVKNNTKTIFQDLSVPQKKAMKLLVKRLFQSGEGILRRLGEGSEQLPKTIAEKFSRHLGKIDLLLPVESFADRRLIKLLPKGAVIGYDLTDINKESAKKIENIDKCFDGSRRRKTQGFFVHGVGFGRFLWRLKVHNSGSEFLPQVRKKILDRLIKITKTLNPIFAFDRGNDDKKLFENLDNQNANFIARLKKNRNLILKESGEIKKVEEIKEGRYTVFIAESGTEQRKKPIYREYELVIYKKQKSKKTPIRLLLSKNLDPEKKLSNKKITNLYLQRWGEENSFKQIKSTLNLEDIRVMKFRKFQNLVSLQHLCMLINELLLHNMQENLKIFKNISLTKIFCEYKKFLKRYTLTLNSHSFFRFLKKVFPSFYRHRKRPKRTLQTSLFQFLAEKVKTF